MSELVSLHLQTVWERACSSTMGPLLLYLILNYLNSLKFAQEISEDPGPTDAQPPINMQLIGFQIMDILCYRLVCLSMEETI
jgi:hypothetical protein